MGNRWLNGISRARGFAFVVVSDARLVVVVVVAIVHVVVVVIM